MEEILKLSCKQKQKHPHTNPESEMTQMNNHKVVRIIITGKYHKKCHYAKQEHKRTPNCIQLFYNKNNNNDSYRIRCLDLRVITIWNIARN